MEIPEITFSSKVKIPQVGLGTWLISDRSECMSSVEAALDTGYRHFDTAQIYENEQYVGESLSRSSVKRKDLFITTKIFNDNMFWDDIIPSFEKSLEKLKTDYVDLLLLHFPVTELRRPAWRKMEEIYKSGKAKSIGVSNYTAKHLEELLKECEIKPAVNQIELHVFLQQTELVKFCNKKGIVLEAYSPLAHGNRMSDKTLLSIAKKHKKTVAQIMIRWCIEMGFVVLPKSVHEKWIKENINVFDFKLDSGDLKKIEGLDDDFRTCWDPTNVA